jgi:ATP/maltotriose-dependent transcriptional regulator MalT
MSTPGLTGLAVPLPELETEHVTASADPVVDEPFVGRAAELAELDRQFALAAAGQGRVVVLAGPAGGGKTALIGRCLAKWAGRAEAALVSGDEAEVALAGGLAARLAQRCWRCCASEPGPGRWCW